MTKYGRKMWLGLLLAIGTIVVALSLTHLSGSVFGTWGWAQFALVLAIGQLVILLLLAGLDTDPNPSLRRWQFVEDPQAEFPLMGAPPGKGIWRRVDPFWYWNALPLLVLGGVLIVVQAAF